MGHGSSRGGGDPGPRARRGSAEPSGGGGGGGDRPAALRAQRARELLRGVPETAPALAEKTSLGGWLRRRAPEEDAVQSLGAEPAIDVLHTLQERAKLQTSFLLAKQKQVHLAGRAAAKRAEDADVSLYVAADRFTRHCAAFEEVGPLLEDVQRACDLVRATVVQCEKLDELLCAKLGEHGDPGLEFPALESAQRASP